MNGPEESGRVINNWLVIVWKSRYPMRRESRAMEGTDQALIGKNHGSNLPHLPAFAWKSSQGSEIPHRN